MSLRHLLRALVLLATLSLTLLIKHDSKIAAASSRLGDGLSTLRKVLPPFTLQHATCARCVMRPARWGIQGKEREWKEKLCKVCVDSLHCDAVPLHGRCLQCARKAIFAAPQTSRSKLPAHRSAPAHCKHHRLEGEVDVFHAMCEVPGCNKQSVFGDDGEGPTRCSQHREQGDKSISRRVCKKEGCSRTPSFGDPEERKAIYCAKHRDASHVDLRSSRCQFDACNKVPSYGVEGGKPLFCTAHKGPQHVDLKNKRCMFVSEDGLKCSTQATFAFKDDPRKLFCRKHATDDCVDVRNRRCDHPEGCLKFGAFSCQNGDLRFCNQHKSEATRRPTTRHLCKNPDGCSRLARYGTNKTGVVSCRMHTQPWDRHIQAGVSGAKSLQARPAGSGKEAKEEAFHRMLFDEGHNTSYPPMVNMSIFNDSTSILFKHTMRGRVGGALYHWVASLPTTDLKQALRTRGFQALSYKSILRNCILQILWWEMQNKSSAREDM